MYCSVNIVCVRNVCNFVFIVYSANERWLAVIEIDRWRWAGQLKNTVIRRTYTVTVVITLYKKCSHSRCRAVYNLTDISQLYRHGTWHRRVITYNVYLYTNIAYGRRMCCVFVQKFTTVEFVFFFHCTRKMEGLSHNCHRRNRLWSFSVHDRGDWKDIILQVHVDAPGIGDIIFSKS